MSDALERAIVQFVIEGAGVAEATSDRVAVKLDSVEKAGRSAESAAASADVAARQMAVQISSALGRLQAAVGLAHRLATLAGAGDSQAFGVIGGALSGASQGLSFGRLFGLPGIVAGAAGGALLGGAAAFSQSSERNDAEEKKRAEEDARRIADALARDASLRRATNIDAYLEQQGEMARLAHVLGGARQSP